MRTHGKNTKPKEIFQIKHFFTISLKVKNNLLRFKSYDYTLSFLPEYIFFKKRVAEIWDWDFQQDLFIFESKIC